MKEQHPISDFTQAAMQNLRSLVDVNAVIGDPVTTSDGTVIIPVSKVSFGYASGGSDLPVKNPDQFGGATGGGVTIQPLAFLVVRENTVELMQLQSADSTGDRIVNAIPGVLDRLIGLIPKKDKKGDEAEESAGE